MRPAEALALAMVLVPALVAAVVLAEAIYDKLYTPLERFGLEDTAYRGMGFEVVVALRNTLSPAPPPWCPSWAPRDGSLSCSCSPVPWGGDGAEARLPEGAATAVTLTGRVPEDADLGPQPAGAVCRCSWTEHCRTVTTTTVKALCCKRVEEGRCVERGVCTHTYTVTETLTRTRTQTTAYTATLTIIPRRVNETLLGLDLDASLVEVLADHPAPGQSSALVNLTMRLYNFGLGMGLGNETPPMEPGMLMLHNLTVLVSDVPVISCRGYCAPAQPLPTGEPQPSIVGSAELILEPRRPTNSYVFNVTICYTEDINSTPARTCIGYNITAPLPFGWKKTIYVADDCHILNETWEVVPANETGYETVLAADKVEPSVSLRDYCIVASAGACEPVLLRVFSDGLLAASRTGRGSVTWCPVAPGVYSATAVDWFNNTARGTFTLTWSAGPPPALRRALLGLAATAIVLTVSLYIVMGGGWPLRGP